MKINKSWLINGKTMEIEIGDNKIRTAIETEASYQYEYHSNIYDAYFHIFNKIGNIQPIKDGLNILPYHQPYSIDIIYTLQEILIASYNDDKLINGELIKDLHYTTLYEGFDVILSKLEEY